MNPQVCITTPFLCFCTKRNGIHPHVRDKEAPRSSEGTDREKGLHGQLCLSAFLKKAETACQYSPFHMKGLYIEAILSKGLWTLATGLIYVLPTRIELR